MLVARQCQQLVQLLVATTVNARGFTEVFIEFLKSLSVAVVGWLSLTNETIAGLYRLRTRTESIIIDETDTGCLRRRWKAMDTRARVPGNCGDCVCSNHFIFRQNQINRPIRIMFHQCRSRKVSTILRNGTERSIPLNKYLFYGTVQKQAKTASHLRIIALDM